MQKEVVDVIQRHARFFTDGPQVADRVGNGEFVDLRAVHVQGARGDAAGGEGAVARVGVHVEVGNVALTGEQRGHEAALSPIDHGRARAVAKEHAGGAVRPVDHAGHALGADHQHAIRLAGRRERVGEIEGVEEARAGCVYVQRRAVRADLRLQEAAEGGGDGVRQDAGCKDIVDVRGGEAGVFQRGIGGAGGELQERLVGNDLPGADACVGADPLVRGIEELAQIIIGERVRGQGAAGPQYPHAFSLLAPSYSSTFWRMNSLMRWSALSSASRWAGSRQRATARTICRWK